MKTQILIYAIVIAALLLSCNSDEVHEMVQTESSTPDTIITYNDKVDEQLRISDTSILAIEHKMVERDALVKENKQLKVELKATKDSLVATKKLIKKRTLIQKILGTNKDTINIKDTSNHVQ